jgi:hypothetical protein
MTNWCFVETVVSLVMSQRFMTGNNKRRGTTPRKALNSSRFIARPGNQPSLATLYFRPDGQMISVLGGGNRSRPDATFPDTGAPKDFLEGWCKSTATSSPSLWPA